MRATRRGLVIAALFGLGCGHVLSRVLDQVARYLGTP